MCRFTRRSSADVAPKRHTAPRARLQAFSVISSEWRVIRPQSRASNRRHSFQFRQADIAALIGRKPRIILTRWASHMGPYTLAYFAGHRDFGTTRRYVHPTLESGKAAMERAHEAQGGYKNGHNADSNNSPQDPADSRNSPATKGLNWYARVDSNHRPFAPEANAQWL